MEVTADRIGVEVLFECSAGDIEMVTSCTVTDIEDYTSLPGLNHFRAKPTALIEDRVDPPVVAVRDDVTGAGEGEEIPDGDTGRYMDHHGKTNPLCRLDSETEGLNTILTNLRLPLPDLHTDGDLRIFEDRFGRFFRCSVSDIGHLSNRPIDKTDSGDMDKGTDTGLSPCGDEIPEPGKCRPSGATGINGGCDTVAETDWVRVNPPGRDTRVDMDMEIYQAGSDIVTRSIKGFTNLFHGNSFLNGCDPTIRDSDIASSVYPLCGIYNSSISYKKIVRHFKTPPRKGYFYNSEFMPVAQAIFYLFEKHLTNEEESFTL
jgi:hypothetical protein